MILTGENVREELKTELETGEETPHLAVLLVGESEASKSFIRKKKEMCKELGFKFTLETFEKGTDTEEIIETIEKLNTKEDVHGILPQLPLPGINENRIFEAIEPEKDVDGLTPENMGFLLRDSPKIVPGTVEAILEILEYYNVEIESQNVTIVNNSNLIGKPLSMALTNRMATVTLCHAKTEDLKKHTRNADILVTATGQPDLITPEMVKEDTVVIDAGYAKEDGKVQGDVKFDEVKEKASKITPNPGGVGPVTVAVTMRNLLKCYRLQQDEN
jgi:methylenetetrahydrofolate dehydrogenase (NADP+)/methenyltetrahydrofolate cyclohydrolase